MAKQRKAAKAKPKAKAKPRTMRRAPRAAPAPPQAAPVAAPEPAPTAAPADPFPRLRVIHAAFARALPPGALSSGVHEPAEGPEAPAADGRYRVDGSDWIMTVAGGRVVLFERARSEGDPAGIVRVPSDG